MQKSSIIICLTGFYYTSVCECLLLNSFSVIVNFLLQKIFRGNFNEAISLVEIHITLYVTLIPTNEIVSFILSRKISLKRKLTFTFQEYFTKHRAEKLFNLSQINIFNMCFHTSNEEHDCHIRKNNHYF